MENMANKLTDREMYRLKDGVMHQHFKDFEYKWGEIRIYCAKVLQSGEYQWIRWSDNEGYDLNDVRRGDVIMLQKMHHSKIGHLIKSFTKLYQGAKIN